MKKTYLIYKIQNNVNSKIYVGITSESLEKRFKRHKYNAKTMTNHTSILYKAFRKYKDINFTIIKVEELKSKDKALFKEVYWIKKLKAKAPNGYNLTDGGQGAFGIKRTKKECKMISERFSKKVIRSDGKLFKNIKNAAKESNTNAANISSSIYGLRGKAGGFYWKFQNNDPLKIRLKNRNKAKINKERTIYRRKPVKCLTTSKSYNSINEAAKNLNCNPCKISLVCSGKRKSHKGLKFKYI